MSDVAINVQGNQNKIEKSQSGFWNKPRNVIFAGIGAAALAYVVWESIFSESGVGLSLQQGVPLTNADPSVGVAAAFFGARKLLSFTGPSYFPRGPAFDLGASIDSDFFLGQRDTSSFVAITQNDIVDAGGDNTEILATVGNFTEQIDSFQVGPDPQPFVPQGKGRCVQTASGNLGCIYSTAGVGGGGVYFTLTDKDGAELVAPQPVFGGSSTFHYVPGFREVGGNFYIWGVTDNKFEIEIRSGTNGQHVSSGSVTVSANTDGPRYSSAQLNSDGTVYGAFESHGTGAAAEITLQKYDATLSAVGSSTSFAGSKPKVVTLPSGEIDVYYLNGDSNLARRRFSFSGTTYSEVGSEAIISSRTLLNYELEEISSGWAAAYSDGQDCYVQPIEADGAVLQEEINTNDSALSQTMCRIKQIGGDLVVGFKRNANAWIRVFKENVAPVVTQAVGNVNLLSGQQRVIDLTQHFSDADVAEFGETLTYSASGTFPGSVQESDLILQPGQGDIGTMQNFTITVEDEAGHSVNAAGSVTTVNQAPTFDETGTLLQTVQEGEIGSTPLPSVSDDGPLGTYSLQNAPVWVSIDSQISIVSAPPAGTVGVFNFDLVYTDTHGEPTTRPVQVTAGDDLAPVFTETTPLSYTVLEGVSKQESLPLVNDNKPGTTLSLQGAPSGITIVENGGSQTTLSIDASVPVGVHNFNFVATDSLGQTSTRAAQVEVTDDLPPVFTQNLVTYSTTAGLTYQESLPSVSDAEGAVTLGLQGAPSGVTIVESSGEQTALSIDETLPVGTHNFNYVATDSLGQTTLLPAQITVAANAAPVMSVTDEWSAELKGMVGVSAPYDFPDVTDEGDVTFYFKGNPSDVSIEEDPLDPTIQTRFIVTPTEAGPLTRTLVARDAQGLETEHEFTIDVAAPPRTSAGPSPLHWTFYAGIIANSLNTVYRLVKRIKNRKLESGKYGMLDFAKDCGYVLYHFTLVLPAIYWCYTKWKYRNDEDPQSKVSTVPPVLRSMTSFTPSKRSLGDGSGDLTTETHTPSRSNSDKSDRSDDSPDSTLNGAYVENSGQIGGVEMSPIQPVPED